MKLMEKIYSLPVGNSIVVGEQMDKMPNEQDIEIAVDEAIGSFHSHLDICDQCRNHPFDLCPTGASLLRAAAACGEVWLENRGLTCP